MTLQTQERPETTFDTKKDSQDSVQKFSQNTIETIQIPDLVLDVRNEARQFSHGLEKPTLFDRISVLGLVLFGGIAVYSFPQKLEQRNEIQQTPTTVQNIQKLRSNHSNTVRHFL